jgi:hypothetical protein
MRWHARRVHAPWLPSWRGLSGCRACIPAGVGRGANGILRGACFRGRPSALSRKEEWRKLSRLPLGLFFEVQSSKKKMLKQSQFDVCFQHGRPKTNPIKANFRSTGSEKQECLPPESRHPSHASLNGRSSKFPPPSNISSGGRLGAPAPLRRRRADSLRLPASPPPR